MTQQIDIIKTATASKFNIALAKLFGKKFTFQDEGWHMTYYLFRGKVYVTEYHDEESNYSL